MFKCPKCQEKLVDNYCNKCKEKIAIINGVYQFTNDANIDEETLDRKYIGYDSIQIHFSPSLIYWGDHYGIFGASAEDIVKRFGKNITILDLGCGLGSATIPFAKAGANVIGVDISQAMLEYTYKRSKGEYDNLYLCRMNAYNLFLEDNSIDVVVENAMLHLVDNPEQVYKEIYRVLKPNGLFIHFSSKSLPITSEQEFISSKCYSAFKDIREYYYSMLKELGFTPHNFNNNSVLIETKYFYTVNDSKWHPVLEYEEEFREYMKFRIHRLRHKAHSFLQHIPDDIHKIAWEKADIFAKEKYGENYIDMPSYSHYNASYDIFFKKQY